MDPKEIADRLRRIERAERIREQVIVTFVIVAAVELLRLVWRKVSSPGG